VGQEVRVDQVVRVEEANRIVVAGLINLLQSPLNCVTLAPVIRRLAKQFAGRLIVGRIDISRSPLAAAHFQIRGVPMLIFFRHGTIVDELAGAPSEAMLVERIESLLRSPG